MLLTAEGEQYEEDKEEPGEKKYSYTYMPYRSLPTCLRQRSTIDQARYDAMSTTETVATNMRARLCRSHSPVYDENAHRSTRGRPRHERSQDCGLTVLSVHSNVGRVEARIPSPMLRKWLAELRGVSTLFFAWALESLPSSPCPSSN